MEKESKKIFKFQWSTMLTSKVALEALHRIQIWIRIFFLFVATSKATIDVEDFIESDYCQLKSENGDITASKIKTGTIKIESDSGDIICSGALQGNVVIKSDSGNVISDKRSPDRHWTWPPSPEISGLQRPTRKIQSSLAWEVWKEEAKNWKISFHVYLFPFAMV